MPESRLLVRFAVREALRFRAFIALAIVTLVFSLLSPEFLTTGNLSILVKHVAINAILAIGMTFVILSGGIDLSVGSVVGLCGMVAGLLLSRGLVLESFGVVVFPHTWFVVVLALLAGMAIGTVNGWIVARLGVAPFIATLGSMYVARGAGLLMSDGATFPNLAGERSLGNTGFLWIGAANMAGLPVPVWLMAALAAIAIFLASRTPFGRHVYAIGGNQRAALLSGVRVPQVRLRVYVISGFCAALVGVIIAAQLGAAPAPGVPDPALILMAKFGVIVSEWMTELDLDATAIQCWSSLQKNYGVNCCTIMSMMSEKLMPSACEVDIAGTVAMYALQLASGRPSALVDWNNNYGDDPDKCVFFHCGNWAKAFLPDITIATAPILGTTLGEKNTYGALAGRTPQGPVTFGRVSTDDREGCIRAYVGQGQLTDDPLQTFGTRAVVHVPELQKLMRFVCRNGFEHHAAMNASHCARILAEAMDTYLGWDVHRHS